MLVFVCPKCGTKNESVLLRETYSAFPLDSSGNYTRKYGVLEFKLSCGHTFTNVLELKVEEVEDD